MIQESSLQRLSHIRQPSGRGRKSNGKARVPLPEFPSLVSPERKPKVEAGTAPNDVKSEKDKLGPSIACHNYSLRLSENVYSIPKPPVPWQERLISNRVLRNEVVGRALSTRCLDPSAARSTRNQAAEAAELTPVQP